MLKSSLSMPVAPFNENISSFTLKKKDFLITFLIFVVNSFILYSISKLSCGCRRVPKPEDQEISKDTWSSANNRKDEKTIISSCSCL